MEHFGLKDFYSIGYKLKLGDGGFLSFLTPSIRERASNRGFRVCNFTKEGVDDSKLFCKARVLFKVNYSVSRDGNGIEHLSVILNPSST